MSANFDFAGCLVEIVEVRTISTKDTKQTQINEEIRATEVRLIDENGEMVGIVSIDEALRLAEQADLDLVRGGAERTQAPLSETYL